MRRIVLQMSMSLDGYVATDRLHPGTAIAEDDELVEWKLPDVLNQDTAPATKFRLCSLWGTEPEGVWT